MAGAGSAHAAGAGRGRDRNLVTASGGGGRGGRIVGGDVQPGLRAVAGPDIDIVGIGDNPDTDLTLLADHDLIHQVSCSGPEAGDPGRSAIRGRHRPGIVQYQGHLDQVIRAARRRSFNVDGQVLQAEQAGKEGGSDPLQHALDPPLVQKADFEGIVCAQCAVVQIGGQVARDDCRERVFILQIGRSSSEDRGVEGALCGCHSRVLPPQVDPEAGHHRKGKRHERKHEGHVATRAGQQPCRRAERLMGRDHRHVLGLSETSARRDCHKNR